MKSFAPRLSRWNCMPLAACTNNQFNSLNITQNLFGSQLLDSPFSEPDRSGALCNNETRNSVLIISAETLCCFHLERRRDFVRDWFARFSNVPTGAFNQGWQILGHDLQNFPTNHPMEDLRKVLHVSYNDMHLAIGRNIRKREISGTNCIE